MLADQSLTWTNAAHISSSMALKTVLYCYVLYWSQTNSWKVIKRFILHLLLSVMLPCSKIITNSDSVLMIGQVKFVKGFIFADRSCDRLGSLQQWNGSAIWQNIISRTYLRTSLLFCYIKLYLDNHLERINRFLLSRKASGDITIS